MVGNKRPHIASLIKVGATAFLLCLSFRISINLFWTVIGVVDLISFCIFFTLIQIPFIKSASSAKRKAGSGLIILFFQVLFLGSILYFRFFHSWLYWDAVYQWANLGELGGALGELLTLKDVILVISPLILWMLVSKKPIAIPKKLPSRLFLSLALLLSLHLLFMGKSFSYGDQNPFFFIFRQKIKQTFSHLKISKTINILEDTIQSRSPIDNTIYSYKDVRGFPLQKVPKQNSPSSQSSPKHNIVFILLESVRSFESGAYGASPSYTPQFDSLASEGMLLKNYYSNGTQTIRSEFALLSSYLPNMHGSPVYLQYPKLSIQTLPTILKEKGYKTLWISGFSPLYGNKKSFLSTHGIDEFYSDIPNPHLMLGWGPSDEDIFTYAASVLDKQTEPFFAEVMTLSNHYPFNHKYPTAKDTPTSTTGEDKLYKNYLKGVYYLDHAMGEFFRMNRDKEWFKRTIFVISADNGIWIFPKKNKFPNFQKQEIYYRIPGLIWNPNLIDPKEIAAVSSQIDIAPTILDLLNIRAENSFLGTSLLRKDNNLRSAYMLREERWNYRQNEDYLYDIGPEVFKEHFPKPSTPIMRTDIRHQGFTTKRDILFSIDPNSLSLMSEDSVAKMKEGIEENLDIYHFLLSNNKIFKPTKKTSSPHNISDQSASQHRNQPSTIAHAGGAARDIIYSNSREALDQSFKKGLRYFEVDIQLTSDNFLVLSHDWKSMFTEPPKQIPTLKQFKSLQTKGNLSLLSFDDLESWLKIHPETFIITDIKNDRYLEILRLIIENYPDLEGRIIPQIYKLSDYSFAKAIGYEKVMFTAYRSKATRQQILNAAEIKELFGIVLPFQLVLDTNFARKLKNRGVFIYSHTVNDPGTQEKLQKKGVDGFFVDFLPDEENNPKINY